MIAVANAVLAVHDKDVPLCSCARAAASSTMVEIDVDKELWPTMDKIAVARGPVSRQER